MLLLRLLLGAGRGAVTMFQGREPLLLRTVAWAVDFVADPCGMTMCSVGRMGSRVSTWHSREANESSLAPKCAKDRGGDGDGGDGGDGWWWWWWW